MRCARCESPALFSLVLRDGPLVTNTIVACRAHTGLALQFFTAPGQTVIAQIQRLVRETSDSTQL